jgi:hypothetical protein
VFSLRGIRENYSASTCGAMPVSSFGAFLPENNPLALDVTVILISSILVYSIGAIKKRQQHTQCHGIGRRLICAASYRNICGKQNSQTVIESNACKLKEHFFVFYQEPILNFIFFAHIYYCIAVEYA